MLMRKRKIVICFGLESTAVATQSQALSNTTNNDSFYCRDPSDVVIRCSYTIFLMGYSQNHSSQRTLLFFLAFAYFSNDDLAVSIINELKCVMQCLGTKWFCVSIFGCGR